MAAAFVSTAAPSATTFAARAQLSTKPVRVSKTVVSMRESRAIPGMVAPEALDGTAVGDVGFDPFGFTEVFNFKFLQEAEIKHCRICMLACLGFLVQEVSKFPFVYFPDSLAVDAHDIMVTRGGMSQILLWVSFIEVFGTAALLESINGDREPGYFGFDPLGLGKNPVAFKRHQLSEIKNGRLAMIGIGGMIHAQWVYHEGILYQLAHFKPMVL